MVNIPWEEFPRPKGLDVNEVTDASDEAENVTDYVSVNEWQAKELTEKARLRPYLAGVVLSTWSVTIMASIIKLLIGGTFLLAVPSILISVPVCIVLRYYFSRR